MVVRLNPRPSWNSPPSPTWPRRGSWHCALLVGSTVVTASILHIFVALIRLELTLLTLRWLLSCIHWLYSVHSWPTVIVGETFDHQHLVTSTSFQSILWYEICFEVIVTVVTTTSTSKGTATYSFLFESTKYWPTNHSDTTWSASIYETPERDAL